MTCPSSTGSASSGPQSLEYVVRQRLGWSWGRQADDSVVAIDRIADDLPQRRRRDLRAQARDELESRKPVMPAVEPLDELVEIPAVGAAPIGLMQQCPPLALSGRE